MILPDIKLFDITLTQSRTPVARQSLGRILRPKPLSLAEIHQRLLAYLMSGRVIEWGRLNGDPKQVALVMIAEQDAKLVRLHKIDFLVYRRPNPIIQLLTLGARK